MLSTKIIKNVEEAAHYFLGQENYYTEGNSLAQEHSQWWGKGAAGVGIIRRLWIPNNLPLYYEVIYPAVNNSEKKSMVKSFIAPVLI